MPHSTIRPHTTHRLRTWTASALLALGGVLGSASAAAEEASPWDEAERQLKGPVQITVYKSPSCGCCTDWAVHLRRHGFLVEEILRDDMAEIKREKGIPARLASCHTAEVGGYLIEGHVPADDIKRLLDERPELAGLAVPGMPAGSPGMEMPDGRRDAFAVVGFERDGSFDLFNYHQ